MVWVRVHARTCTRTRCSAHKPSVYRPDPAKVFPVTTTILMTNCWEHLNWGKKVPHLHLDCTDLHVDPVS